MDSDLVENPEKEGEDWKETHAMNKMHLLYNIKITTIDKQRELSMTYKLSDSHDAKVGKITNTYNYHQNV